MTFLVFSKMLLDLTFKCVRECLMYTHKDPQLVTQKTRLLPGELHFVTIDNQTIILEQTRLQKFRSSYFQSVLIYF